MSLPDTILAKFTEDERLHVSKFLSCQSNPPAKAAFFDVWQSGEGLDGACLRVAGPELGRGFRPLSRSRSVRYPCAELINAVMRRNAKTEQNEMPLWNAGGRRSGMICVSRKLQGLSAAGHSSGDVVSDLDDSHVLPQVLCLNLIACQSPGGLVKTTQCLVKEQHFGMDQ